MMNRRDAVDDADRFAQSEGRWGGVLTASDLRVSRSADASSSGVPLDRDALVQQIKHSFEQETQSFRSRILEATDEAARARERIDDVQHEMLRLRKKCAKLHKLLQERDATIACLHEQQDLQLPMLMQETMRGLQNAMENNQDEANNDQQQHHDQSMRASVHRNRLQRSILQEERDERVHEYEKQISRLYEELHQEKQKNEMLQECLKEQKHAKAKLMKACKFARREIEALKQSDLTHLLEDLEIKCRELEHRNAALQDDLDFEKTQAATARQERDDIEDELASRRQDSSDWAARLEAKQREIERLRSQIHEQQCALENYQRDYDLVAERTAPRSDTSMQGELQQECDLLIRALHRERARVAELERTLQDETPSPSRQERPRSRTRSQPEEMDTVPVDVAIQIGSVCDKIRNLHRRVREYTETQGLSSSSSSFRRSRAESSGEDRRRETATSSLVDGARAGEALSQCCTELDSTQRLMEETFARALGNNCAMQ